jgi:hypothetical protein
MRLVLCVSLTLLTLSCTNNQKANDRKIRSRTKLKSDFIFKNKTIKNDTLIVDSTKNRTSKTHNIKFENKKKTIAQVLIDRESKKVEVKDENANNNPVLIPEKWSKAYSSDPKWMELYEETSSAFLTGWTNEFETNPSAKISREELLFAYRRRMEKIFYDTPSFIEFSATELSESEKFKSFISDFPLNIK